MEELQKYRGPLKQALEKFINDKLDESDGLWTKDFLKRLKLLIAEGKQLRGCLVCYTYRIYSGSEPSKEIISTAIAIELLHTGLIIQDDVMDGDELRRGRPSIHSQYRQKGLKTGINNSDKLGESLALCASDIVIFLAFELLAEATDNPKLWAKLNKNLTRSLIQVCEGQMLDIYLEKSIQPLNKKLVIDVMRLKTASYSITLPMTMGAILADAPRHIIDSLSELGTDTGIIFQIRDDELGVLGDSKRLGKPVGSDIKQGKKTLLYYYLVNNCSTGEQSKLKDIFGNQKSTDSDIRFVQKLMVKRKIPAYISDDIAKLKDSAFKKIDGLKLPTGIKIDLIELVDFCASRNL